MKKFRVGSIEIFGCIGLLMWLVVIALRFMQVSGGTVFTAVVGRLPNWGAAWIVTLLCKCGILFVCKRKYTITLHACICLGIFLIAVISEIFFYFCGRSFDVYDLLATVAAQVIMFFTPIITKDACFVGDEEKE